ncbi:MAG: SDR family NAD(P)-dependent oxidoreductase [Anaerolineae bacterium]|nr:SDR family NAD(P)-dependent oxidoreductase [Anaerolineae bacterium]
MAAKTWFITGCATGFGARLAQRLLDAGETVIATDRDASALDHLHSTDKARLLKLQLDVRREDEITAAVQQALDHFGKIDLLVNNAGVGHGGPIEEATMDEVRFVMDVNALGVIGVTKAVLPHMHARGEGHIINLSSDSGKVGFPFQGLYTAAKHAVEGFSEVLWHEVSPFGLKVTLVEPCGMFKTAMPRDAIDGALRSVKPGSPYYAWASHMGAEMKAGWEHSTDPDLVVDAILEVAADPRPPLRRRAGLPDRTGLVGLRNQMPEEAFVEFIQKVTRGAVAPGERKGRLNGGDLVVRVLRDAGVTHCFTIVGGHNYHLVNACLEAGLTVVDVRHEMNAAHMADAWARFTGKPALVAVDAAPGLVNAVPGIEVAYEAQVPMIVINAQGSLEGRDLGVMQAIDQLRLLRPITKWQRTCFELKRLPEYTATALRYATTGRPGPVFLDFPLELLHATMDEDEVTWPANYRPAARPLGDPEQVRAALDILRTAKKPLVVAGSGVWWAGAGDELCRFVKATGVPVLTRNLARGLLPDDHPLACGFYPTPAAGADAFLILGTRLDWTVGFGQFPLFDRDAKVAQVDITPEAIGKNRPIHAAIVGDAGQVLRQMLALLPELGEWSIDPAWPARAHRSLTAMREGTAREAKIADRPPGKLMHSIQLVQELARILPREAIKVVDGGYSGAFGIQYFDANVPGGVTWVGSAAHLGVGLAYAISAKLAHPDAPVVAFMGDGSFGLCAMEFDTAVRHGVPIVVVIANDEGWGEVRDGQRRRFGDDHVVGTNLGATRYDELARALGGHGEFVECVDELEPVLRRAFDSALPAIVNVHTDPEQRSTAVAGLPWITE